MTGYCSQKYQTGSIYVGETLQETETYQRSQQTVKMYEKYFCNFLKREIDKLKSQSWVAENKRQPNKEWNSSRSWPPSAEGELSNIVWLRPWVELVILSLGGWRVKFSAGRYQVVSIFGWIQLNWEKLLILSLRSKVTEEPSPSHCLALYFHSKSRSRLRSSLQFEFRVSVPGGL